MKLVKLILLVLSSFLLSLLILEGFFRCLPVRSVLRTNVLNDTSPIPSFIPNEKGIWSRDWNFSIVNSVVTNNLGFPNHHNYTASYKPTICIIGDSFVEAAMTPYEKTFHGMLSQMLHPNMNVYTFAMSGASLPNYLVWARYATEKFAPCKIFFVIIPNDYDESLSWNKCAPGSYYFFPDAEGKLKLSRIDFSISYIRTIVRNSALLSYVTQNLGLWQWLKTIYYTDAQFDLQCLDTVTWLREASHELLKIDDGLLYAQDGRWKSVEHKRRPSSWKSMSF
jgi:hypothetical protein